MNAKQRQIFWISHLLVIVISLAVVINEDKINCFLSKENYINSQAHQLKTQIELDTWKLEELQVNLEKQVALENIDLKQAEIEAKRNSKDIDKSKKDVLNRREKMISDIKNQIVILKDESDKNLKKLDGFLQK